jgi:hypothetical protein
MTMCHKKEGACAAAEANQGLKIESEARIA